MDIPSWFLIMALAICLIGLVLCIVVLCIVVIEGLIDMRRDRRKAKGE